MKYLSIAIIVISTFACAQTHITAGNLNQICFADQQVGANLGIKVNACDTALGANAGEIWINHYAGTTWTTAPSFSAPRRIRFIDGGSYSIPLGTLVFNKQVMIDCGGRLGAQLTFTGGSGIAMLFNYAQISSGSFQDWGYGMSGCQLVGPGGFNGGVGNAGTGIQVGDATHSTIGFNCDNCFTAGFAIGITWANLTAYGSRIVHSNFINNTQDVVFNIATAGGMENVVFDHCLFGDSTGATIRANDFQITNTGTIELACLDCSFDDSQINIGGTGSVVHFVNKHHEVLFNNATVPMIISAGEVIDDNPVFQTDGTVTSPPQFVTLSGGVYSIKNLVGNSQAGAPVTNYLNQSAGTFINSGGPLILNHVGNYTNSVPSSPFLDANVGIGGYFNVGGLVGSKGVYSNVASACTNGELALSAGWGSTATVTAVSGKGQHCRWTITSNGSGAGANPTITDTLLNALPDATTDCLMYMVGGGTGTFNMMGQTSLSQTAPVFTFFGTPAGAGATYNVERICGP